MVTFTLLIVGKYVDGIDELLIQPFIKQRVVYNETWPFAALLGDQQQILFVALAPQLELIRGRRWWRSEVMMNRRIGRIIKIATYLPRFLVNTVDYQQFIVVVFGTRRMAIRPGEVLMFI